MNRDLLISKLISKYDLIEDTEQTSDPNTKVFVFNPYGMEYSGGLIWFRDGLVKWCTNIRPSKTSNTINYAGINQCSLRTINVNRLFSHLDEMNELHNNIIKKYKDRIIKNKLKKIDDDF